MENEFVTIEQVASFLKFKRSFVYSSVECGKLSFYRIGRRIRFKQSNIDSWAETHRQDPSDIDRKVMNILRTQD